MFFFSVNSVHPIIFSSTDVSLLRRSSGKMIDRTIVIIDKFPTGIPNQGELYASGFSALTVGYSSGIVIIFANLRETFFYNLVKVIFIHIHM